MHDLPPRPPDAPRLPYNAPQLADPPLARGASAGPPQPPSDEVPEFTRPGPTAYAPLGAPTVEATGPPPDPVEPDPKSEALPSRPASTLSQAQLATFAAERVGGYEDKEHIFTNLGNLATAGQGSSITRTLDTDEYHEDEHGAGTWLPEGEQHTIATADEYADFLETVGPDYGPIQARTNMLERYEDFAATVNGLKEELAELETPSEHPAHLGSGLSSDGFRITVDGNEYAVRIPSGTETHPRIIDQHLESTIAAEGVPLLEQHLEKVVAASYEDGVTVGEVLPGKQLGDLTIDEIRQIDEAQLGEWVDTVTTAIEHGIEVDPNPSNTFYGPEAGFGINDCSVTKADQDVGTAVGLMSVGISNAGVSGDNHQLPEGPEGYALRAEILGANLTVLEQYRTVVTAKLGGDDQQKALGVIDQRIQVTQQRISDFSNPDWVAGQIALRERAEQASERSAGPSGRASIELDVL